MPYDDNFMEHLVADAFHVMYYHSNVWNGANTKWLGVGIFNNPFDMWVKQEIIFETKPTLIIETGTAMGGSSLFFATLLDQMGEGRIVSIDVWNEKSGMGLPKYKHKRVNFWKASSVDPVAIKKIKSMIKPKDRVMVFLDSDHSAGHVLKELKLYGPMVTPGCYMVVDDTNLGGHPIMNATQPGPGPWGAVEEFLKKDDTFEVDISRHKFYMTWSINGFLKKKE
jgi:cephalosporin hydroxylase